MRRLPIAATTLFAVCALAAPLPALAQERPIEEDAAAMARTMSDPARQQDMAMMLRAMAEVMLDLPIAPLVEAMEEASGEKGPEVAPGATLRSLSPEAAGRVPELVEKGVPRAMTAMGAMAQGAGTMAPAMRDMAKKMAPLLEGMGEAMAKGLVQDR